MAKAKTQYLTRLEARADLAIDRPQPCIRPTKLAPSTIHEELLGEIQERHEFLSEMRQLGSLTPQIESRVVGQIQSLTKQLKTQK
jgi:hypothetical protein